MKQGSIAKAFSPEAKLKRNIRRHFTKLGFAKADDGTLILPGEGKEVENAKSRGAAAWNLI